MKQKTEVRRTDFVCYFFILFLIIWLLNKGLGKKARETSPKLFSPLITIFLKPTQTIFVTEDTGRGCIRATMEVERTFLNKTGSYYSFLKKKKILFNLNNWKKNLIVQQVQPFRCTNKASRLGDPRTLWMLRYFHLNVKKKHCSCCYSTQILPKSSWYFLLTCMAFEPW